MPSFIRAATRGMENLIIFSFNNLQLMEDGIKF